MTTQWNEERMIEKEDTSLEFNESVFDNLLACLSIILESQSHFFSLDTDLEIDTHE